MGMVGGSYEAFIGAVHRRAALMDGEIELVCGAFSSDPLKCQKTGEALYLPADRVYGSSTEMFEKEKQLPEGERMDFVAIVTPNHAHHGPTKMALENGFHVVCDKPITLNTAEAEEIVALVEKTGLVFCLTHNYTGYPMVKEARQMIKNGVLGKIRKVIVEYPQGGGHGPKAGRLAYRPGTIRGGRRTWRHRDPRRKLGRIHHGLTYLRSLCRPEYLCRRPPPRRRRSRAAPLQ